MKKLFLMLALTGMVGAVSASTVSSLSPGLRSLSTLVKIGDDKKGDDKKKDKKACTADEKNCKKGEKSCCKKKDAAKPEEKK